MMNRSRQTRREFLSRFGLAAASWCAASNGWVRRASGAPSTSPSPGTDRLVQLSEHLAVFQGPIQVGVLRNGATAMLIDCGDARVLADLKPMGISAIEQVVFTHHHRDQACGAQGLVDQGARLLVPAAERQYFDNVAAYWNSPASRWHIYNQHPHRLMLAEPVRVDGVVSPGERLSWGHARIQVLATPGHTDGSLSYLVEVDGKRIVFCGDAIYGVGTIWELYSLQKGTMTTDYHGFLGARPQLVQSLQRIKQGKPDALVPSHGRILDDPARAIDSLIDRLDRCYDKYVAISALRHYFPKMFAEYAGRKDHMPIGPGKPVPACLRHVGTSWIVLSKDKAAWVIDCGSPTVVKQLVQWQKEGEIAAVEGLWVTHYHDDHVDAIPEFQKTFSCPCVTDRHVADVITDPLAWRLPCISPHRARVDRATADGESWTWHEFRLTAFHLPGQTLYHSGLLVESGDLRMLFVGDSFTMAGIDDYCAQNRNWLGKGVGFDRCLELIEKLRPTHLFNCHVNDAFQFTEAQCRFMRSNLAEREKLFGELFPWDHPNYGMDELWVRCHPYEQKGVAGGQAELRVVVTNHSAVEYEAACRAVLPRAWGGGATAWTHAPIPPKAEAPLGLKVPISGQAGPGRYVIPVDIRYGPWHLPQWTEAVVVL